MGKVRLQGAPPRKYDLCTTSLIGGKVATLAVFKDSYQEMNELRHDQLTLEKCGIKGVSDKENAPTVTLYYDFKHDGCSDPDPLLLC